MAADPDTLVCPECFGKLGLKRRIIDIRPQFDLGNCEYHPTRKGVPLSAAAEIVDEVARENFGGGHSDGSEETYGGRDLDDLVCFLTEAKEDDVAQGIKEWLKENDSYWPPDGEDAFYDDDYVYYPAVIGADSFGRLWDDFQRTLMHEQRFFSARAFDLLHEIFENVDRQTDDQKRSPVYMIKPGDDQSSFFRARTVTDYTQSKQFSSNIADELGPPPARKRTAGRLNPSGVCAFYGAFDIATCVAELRPPVGIRVALAKFEITEPICVLDTTRFAGRPKNTNMYQKGALKVLAQWNFMRGFMDQISKPVKPGEEHLDYIPTQAVAEFLANHYKVILDGKLRNIDAIIYSSAQNHGEGKNIALLGAASITGDVDEKGNRVGKGQTEDERFFDAILRGAEKVRIRPVQDSFTVHEVRGVKFSTDERAALYMMME